MFERFLKYFKDREFYPNTLLYTKAVDIVKNIWQKYYGQSLKVSSVMESYHNLPKNTSAGFPFKSGIKKGEVKNYMIYLARKQWNRIKQGKLLQVVPCKSGARCQLRKRGSNKPRLIWAYPGYITVIENQYLTSIKDHPPPNFMGWSVNWLDQGKSLTRLMYGDGNTWRSIAQIDFSSFDATVRSELIYSAFSIVRSLFDLSSVESRMLDQLRYYFIHTPIVFYNEVYVTSKGIPSGSGFTQLIGSIVNMIACTYSSLRSREFNLRHEYSCWLGDDSLLNFKEALARDEFDKDYLQHFKELGLEVSVDKTHYTTRFYDEDRFLIWNERPTVKFLGKEIDVMDLTFHNDVKKLEAQIALPERQDHSPYETGVRLIGLVWAYGMHYDIYLKILKIYLSLNLHPIYGVHTLIKASTKPDKTRQYVEHFLTSLKYQLNITVEIHELFTFPSFWDVSNRYFGPKYERLKFRSHKILD
nr:RNA-dependent RNA polymerase [Partitiviridae sp.]